jgi:hypothetical protein
MARALLFRPFTRRTNPVDAQVLAIGLGHATPRPESIGGID